ncbi:MAG: endonuclease/exonuclease/phosphatase family protein [Bacteroidota bacterium]
MKKKLSILLFLLLTFQGFCQSFSLVSWNIKDLGGSKNDQEIRQMANLLRKHDLIAIQEVVAKDPRGAKAVARLADELNRMGARWDYRVSNPTQSPSSYSSERYAFIWKTAKLTMVGKAVLDLELVHVCWREPYIAQFRLKGDPNPFYIVNVHSRTFDKKPEEEIAHIVTYPLRLKTDRVIIAGDFNMDETNPAWTPLYSQGYVSALKESKTTLKRKCASGVYLNYPIDNIYFHPGFFSKIKAGKIDFVGRCASLESARNISDHLPVYLHISLQ